MPSYSLIWLSLFLLHALPLRLHPIRLPQDRINLLKPSPPRNRLQLHNHDDGFHHRLDWRYHDVPKTVLWRPYPLLLGACNPLAKVE